ncbi:MAG: hypothetical protein IRY83_14945 [Chloroflexi bacterium]|nr:hypothetical protein [Chloroflexota bacterium]
MLIEIPDEMWALIRETMHVTFHADFLEWLADGAERQIIGWMWNKRVTQGPMQELSLYLELLERWRGEKLVDVSEKMARRGEN